MKKWFLPLCMAALCPGIAFGSNIATNPGFETGDLTAWTAAAGGAQWDVGGNNGLLIAPHSGSYFALTSCFGPTCLSPTIGSFLYQNLATAIGATYTIGFWYDLGQTNLQGANPPGLAELRVEWGPSSQIILGVSADDQPDPGWVYFTIDETATSSSTQLEFFGRQDNTLLGVDDVCVDVAGGACSSSSATPEPASLLLLGCGLAWLGCLALRRRSLTMVSPGAGIFRGVRVVFTASLLLTAGLCSAATISFTGILTSADTGPGAMGTISLDLAATSNITLQSYGFGGGVNGAGTTIAPGGFDPFVGLFEGTGPSALLIDGTADNLSNYTSEPSACPPAGSVTIGSVTGQCGDVRLQFTLTPGTYTVIVTDANYVPNAVYETTGYLGDGFSDLTGGVMPFTTCYDGSDCNTDTANWALDVTTSAVSSSSVPEPASFVFAGVGLIVVSRLSCKRRS